MDSVTFGDLDLSTGGLALLDTGSTNLMMPKEVSLESRRIVYRMTESS